MWSLLPQVNRQIAVRWLATLAARRIPARKPEAGAGSAARRVSGEGDAS